MRCNSRQTRCNSRPNRYDACATHCDSVVQKNYDCGTDRQVVHHQYVVKHQHDIVNEYDIVHEHDYNYYDVVTHREVVRHNDYTSPQPDYCNDTQNCECLPRNDGMSIAVAATAVSNTAMM